MQGRGNIKSIVENMVEFPRGLVEIRQYHWPVGNDEVWRLHPDMYIFELNLSKDVDRSPAEPQRHGSTEPRLSRRSDVTITPPGDKIDRTIESGWRKSLLCWLDGEWITDFIARQNATDRAARFEGSFVADSKFEWILRNIYKEIQHQDLGSALMIESLVNCLTVEFARKLNAAPPPSDARKGGLSPWRLRRVQQRMQETLAAPSLTELAEICGLTVRHFSRAFKTETGLTPGQYIDAIRADHARHLLSMTDASYAEIAHRLGFATSSSFSAAFQRATGLLPRQIERPSRPS